MTKQTTRLQRFLGGTPRMVFFSIILLTAYPLSAQDIALKTNLLHDATTTLNLGAEFAINDRWTTDIPFSWNPWTYGGDKKMKLIAIQPELRYWLTPRTSNNESAHTDTHRYGKHFFGLHLHYIRYNIGGMALFGLEDFRHQGNAYGAGLAYGYRWNFKQPRWSMEASLGVGYVFADNHKYPCASCGKRLERSNRHYVGPTRAAISLIYTLK